jgi:acyl transferase domain-containing protein
MTNPRKSSHPVQNAAATPEYLAVVGLACRFPQAPDPASFWRMLIGGSSGITEPPEGRWAGDRTWQGGFLADLDGFDPEFFGISPREARSMDPHQRLMLELSWEALEDARILPAALRGSRTGVFVGSMSEDYPAIQLRRAIHRHTLTGAQRSIIANRVSYTLGLHGPSLTVDTGQSSGLVAVHLACESLRTAESNLALAAGVNLNLLLEGTVSTARLGALSADGECFTFDARANGYVRGEGGGVVVLKRLADAIADGDQVYCVVRGSAVNSDGTTDGLTVPSVTGQSAVLREAYARARVDPTSVQYVELHGTGTKVGDPVEAEALHEVLGAGRDAGHAVRVGSAKTNIGHLEGAAGIAGFIKTALALRHRLLPSSRNFVTPNPLIPLEALGLAVQDRTGDWPDPATPLVAGVSSFGMGGTNCHVVLAAVDAAPRAAGSDVDRVLAWPLSARTPRALRGQAARLAGHVREHLKTSPATVARSLVTTRTTFDHRAVVVGSSHADLLRGLDEVSRRRPSPAVVTGTARGGRTAFLFTGQGSQRAGAGRGLYAAEPAFAAALDEICAQFAPHLDPPLRTVMFAEDGAPEAALLDDTRYTQAALFAIEVAMCRLLDAYGVRPDYLLGHSIGELAAAHVAGVLTLADACTVVAARGCAMCELPEDGAMIALRASAEEAAEALADWTGRLSLAAVNGPRSVVISGDRDAAAAVAEAFRAKGRRTRTLRVSHAFHSPHLDGRLDAFGEVAAGVSYQEPTTPLISNVTGREAGGDDLRTPEYWLRQAREPVQFWAAMRHLLDQGVTTFVEVGPDGVLIGLAQECLPPGHHDVGFVPALRSAGPEPETFVAALAAAYGRGIEVNWQALVGAGEVGDLPTYAFDKRPFPVETGSLPPVPSAEPEPEPVPFDASPLEVLGTVLSVVSAVLGHDGPDAVDPSRTFKELGFDSLAAAEFATRLSAATGIMLPSSLAYDYPTPKQLASWLGNPEGAVPDEAAAYTDEPIAIVGMACRLPGDVHSPDGLWALLAQSGDATGPFPADRGWPLDQLYDLDPDHPGTSYVRDGGFLYDAGDFDAAFFGISPREAAAIDPQQRLLLELAWESLEDAGILPATLEGSPTGVYIGLSATDYGPRLYEPADGHDGYLLTGATPSVASGRIAYALGLNGPAITIDTACSSSLVATHLATAALRQNECKLALAGGAAVMANPGMFIEFSRQRGLAADGRCKPFSDDADGTGWAEGAGLLVLERLSDAQRNGHRVHAVIRGSAINQDGASNGLTAPNGPAQQRVISAALARAGLAAADIDAVEAHGTGTTLGDPIEANALAAAYRDRDRPLFLGSLKSNIGHTQAAAGVAAIIKMTQAIKAAQLPPTLHAGTPSRHVDWKNTPLRLLTETTPWPDMDRPRRAGVSSFGVSGTNAHLILEQAPQQVPDGIEGPSQDGITDPTIAILLSGKTRQAVHDGAARLRDWLSENPGTALPDLAHELAGRTHHPHRAVILTTGPDQLRGQLGALAAGRTTDPDIITGHATDAGKLVFCFPGQGAQWTGMTSDLAATNPHYRRHLGACDTALLPHTGHHILDTLHQDTPPLHNAETIQPALFAVTTALARYWNDCGLRPDAVIGHSQGEIGAACCAGALTLTDAAAVVTRRARTLAAVAGTGTMATVHLSADELAPHLGNHPDVHIAAYNSPGTTIVAGPEAQLSDLLQTLGEAGVRTRTIPVDYPSHTPHMWALRDALLDAISHVDPLPARTPFYSTLHPQTVPTDTTTLGGTYWYDNLANPVHLSATVSHLLDSGHTYFLEITPHPVLTTNIEETIHHHGADARAMPTLRRDRGTHHQLLTTAAHLHTTRRQPLDWKPLLPPATRTTPPAPPTYPFQHARYWLHSVGSRQAAALGQQPSGHPLASSRVDLADMTIYTARLDPQRYASAEERPNRSAAVLVDLVLHAGADLGFAGLRRLVLRAPLRGPERDLRVIAGRPGDDGREISVESRVAGSVDLPWEVHATGTLGTVAPATPTAGPGGRTRVSLPAETDTAHHQLHPDLLESVFDLVTDEAAEPGAVLSTLSGVRLQAGRPAEVSVAVRRAEPGMLALDASDAGGNAVFSIDSIELGSPPDTHVDAATYNSLFAVRWTRLPAPETAATTHRYVEAGPTTGLAVDVGGRTAVVATPGEYDGDSVPARTHAVLRDMLATIRNWIALDESVLPPLVVVTRKAISTDSGEPGRPGDAAIWGLTRAAQREYPGLITLVDLDDADLTTPTLDAVLALAEPEVAVRNGEFLVPRLRRATERLPQPHRPLDPDGTVLVTGAGGALGRLVARHLITSHGIRHLLLVSRRGLHADGMRALRDELAEGGAHVRVEAADLAEPAAVAGVLATVDGDHPLTAVIHAAGTMEPATLPTLTDEQLDRVLRPKVDAAWHLHEATRDLDLAAFVVFSSIAATFDAAGQGNYAAANAFLDALTPYRRAEGLAGLSVAWGPWDAGSGMLTRLHGPAVERLARNGMSPMAAEHALALLDVGLNQEVPALVAVQTDMAKLRAQGRAGHLPSLFGALVPQAAPAAGASDGPARPLAERIRDLDEADRLETVLRVVRSTAASILALTTDEEIPGDQAFKDAGFDSLTAVQLARRLGETAGLSLPTTVAFDIPTPVALARHLIERLVGAPAERNRTMTAIRADEPIAIVGMACRLPGGVHTPEELWQLVAEATDAVGAFPADRGWKVEELYDPDPDKTGHSYVRRGGFLYDAGDFDSAFFGISPREAAAVDPQQRLLLELAWESLERASIDPSGLAGSETGVFIGIGAEDYGPQMHQAPAGHEGFLLTGQHTSVASGRISYALGLQGPALTINTACSSSLVATHLAAAALRRGECDLALAGGATVMATPGLFVEFSRQRGLAPDGRCKAFSDSADGTGWAEGAGLLVLERLSDAQHNGHHILAVVRGSAVNQDGASNGLTAPNGPAQQRVINAALASAGLTPADIDAVEAHGTGTTLGDPIEANALAAAFADRREPLYLGSLKSNIGHVQAAAGVAGIIKMVTALAAGVLPKTLHISEPSRHVDWENTPLRLLAAATPWPDTGRPRRVGVSSFGVSGTNAHLILEQPPSPEPADPPPADLDPPVVPILLSGKTRQALLSAAEQLATWLQQHPDTPLPDLAHVLSARTHHPHRAVLLPTTLTELAQQLAALTTDQPHPRVTTGETQPTHRKTAFLYPGQGAQQPAAGHTLYQQLPAFRTTIDTIAEQFPLNPPLTQVMFAEPGTANAELLNDTRYTQAALFTLGTALHQLLTTCGITPDYHAGHSIGEITAAHTAGTLTLKDATTLITARAELMHQLPPGAMLTTDADPDTITTQHPDITIAAYNSPTHTVLSGNPETMREIATELAIGGHKTQLLNVGHAYHSADIDAILDQFTAATADITYQASTIPVISNTTGQPAVIAGDHFARQLRQPVRYADTIIWLHEHDVTTYLELGPHHTLTTLTTHNLPTTTDITQHTLLDQPHDLYTALAHLHTTGTAPVNWTPLLPPPHNPHQSPTPPTYPFQHDRYWLRTGAGAAATADAHPLLGSRVPLAGTPARVFAQSITRDEPSFVDQHRLHDTPVLPAAAMVEWMVSAAQAVAPDASSWLLEGVEFHKFLPIDRPVRIQARVDPEADGWRISGFGSREQGDEWTDHVTVERATRQEAPPAARDIEALREGLVERDLDGLYDRIGSAGLRYGPRFRGLTGLFASDTTALGRIVVPIGDDAEAGRYRLHPAVLDACIQVAAAFVADETLLWLPTGVDRLVTYGPLPGRVWSRAKWHGRRGDGETVMDLEVVDDNGRILAELDGVRLRALSPAGLAELAGTRVEPYEVRWQPWRLPAESDDRDDLRGWLISAADSASAEPWLSHFRRSGVPVSVITGTDDETISRAVSAFGAAPTGVVLSGGREAGTDSAVAAEHLALRTLLVLKHVLQAYAGARPRIVACSTGAAAPRPGDAADPVEAMLTAAVRAVAAEHPELHCVQVDRDPAGADAVEPPMVLRAATSAEGSAHLAVRDDRWYIARLQVARLSGGRPAIARPRPDASYLVTGGLGGLGLVTARWLTEQGARTVVLAGRHVPEVVPETVRRLRADGVRVELHEVDITDRPAVAALLRTIRAELPPLRGVVHAAGTTADAPLEKIAADQVSAVMGPKVRGAWHLHTETSRDELDFFVAYSSLASMAGSPGQAGYVAANAFLDALASMRRAAGLPGLSVSWGPWAQVGMAARRGLLEHLAAAGLDAMTTDEALSALADTPLDSVAHVGLARVSWLRRQEAYAGVPDLLLTDLSGGPAAAPVLDGAVDLDDLTKLVLEEPARAREGVLTVLLERVGHLIGLSAEDRSALRSTFAGSRLSSLGLDSLTTVRLRGRLLADLDVDVAPDVLFGETAGEVADQICQQLAVRAVLASAGEAMDTDEIEVLTL